MVTVWTCSTLPEAQVLQSPLGGSGIRAFLPDEMTVQMDWMWANAIGGVRVQVAEEDAERAIKFLQSMAISPLESEVKTHSECENKPPSS